MMLYPGEVGVCSEQMYAWAPPRQVPGTLYLTNLRLVFEAVPLYQPEYAVSQALGLAPQGPPPMLNLEVRAITNVAAIPAPSGWHTLRVEANGGAYVYNFQTPRASEWVTSIQGARGQAPLPSSGPPAYPSAPPLPAAAAPRSAPPAPSAAPASAPAPAVAPGPAKGTVWCTRCGKANPSGAAQCANCGAGLG